MAKAASENNSMEQVRELLMGNHLKDMEQRVQRQEERLMKEFADLRDNCKSRLDTLENFMKSESASLLHRLQEAQAAQNENIRHEQAERGEALARLAGELAQQEDALSRRLGALSGTLDTVEQNLRRLLLEENARLSELIGEKYKDSLAALHSAAGQIREDMVSRSALSGFLMEMAMKVSGHSLDPEDDSAPRAHRDGQDVSAKFGQADVSAKFEQDQ